MERSLETRSFQLGFSGKCPFFAYMLGNAAVIMCVWWKCDCSSHALKSVLLKLAHVWANTDVRLGTFLIMCLFAYSKYIYTVCVHVCTHAEVIAL